MRITNVIWLPGVVEKLTWKHNLRTDEVEQVLRTNRDLDSLNVGSIKVRMFTRRSAKRMKEGMLRFGLFTKLTVKRSF